MPLIPLNSTNTLQRLNIMPSKPIAIGPCSKLLFAQRSSLLLPQNAPNSPEKREIKRSASVPPPHQKLFEISDETSRPPIMPTPHAKISVTPRIRKTSPPRTLFNLPRCRVAMPPPKVFQLKPLMERGRSLERRFQPDSRNNSSTPRTEITKMFNNFRASEFSHHHRLRPQRSVSAEARPRSPVPSRSSSPARLTQAPSSLLQKMKDLETPFVSLRSASQERDEGLVAEQGHNTLPKRNCVTSVHSRCKLQDALPSPSTFLAQQQIKFASTAREFFASLPRGIRNRASYVEKSQLGRGRVGSVYDIWTGKNVPVMFVPQDRVSVVERFGTVIPPIPRRRSSPQKRSLCNPINWDGLDTDFKIPSIPRRKRSPWKRSLCNPLSWDGLDTDFKDIENSEPAF